MNLEKYSCLAIEYWDWRLKVERSKAIKCPSIQYQLAGVKKVQQRLADPSVLRSFLIADHDQAEIARISAVFTGIYSLDQGDEGDAMESAAHEQPERFVLKPQREGGGNNVYGEEISQVLKALQTTPKERSAYILMDRIVPPKTPNYLVRPSASTTLLTDVVSELGIYGIILGSDKEVFLNEDIGYLLRTKPSTADEGGVVAGYACLDTMILT